MGRFEFKRGKYIWIFLKWNHPENIYLWHTVGQSKLNKNIVLLVEWFQCFSVFPQSKQKFNYRMITTIYMKKNSTELVLELFCKCFYVLVSFWKSTCFSIHHCPCTVIYANYFEPWSNNNTMITTFYSQKNSSNSL